MQLNQFGQPAIQYNIFGQCKCKNCNV